ncbi:hypothetical protein QR680_016979 [Steinernema hermaphroditum]|uniref:Uncharacterized protein n=1 Tax=Steinernema hermaphroditum TaxID=289476 RepID=A0AA39LNI3_9BILA|nr:hypothetical protein QR680_016979 [Steinernema hermaphroditum]
MIGRTTLALLLLLGACTARKEQVCDERTGECLSKEHMFNMMNLMRVELAQHEQDLAASNCTICNIKEPCLNGGTCIPLSGSNYGCRCPDDTSGFNCERKIKCRANSCGENAHCYIANHKVNCVCDKGFTGDPFWGCKQHYRQSCASGDPHFTTFDGSYYDYQGTCPYVLSQPCTSLQGFSFYSVKARNKAYHASSHVAYVSEIEVVMHNKTIHVDEDMNLYVDGINTFYPFYYPSRENRMVTVKRIGDQVVIKNDENVQVTFYVGYLCVRVPDIPEFQGKHTLCGLAGNLDGECKDDFIGRQGQEANPHSSDWFNDCRFNFNDEATRQIAKVEDTWRTDTFQGYSQTDACVDGETMANITTHCELTTTSEQCKPIKEAMNATGPFASCMELGYELIDSAYSNCEYDLCYGVESLCGEFKKFVTLCQSTLGNVDLSTWRAETNCKMNCQPHSSYVPCMSACQDTCAQPDSSSQCDQPCLEGCACDPGYVVDTTRNPPACIQIGQCGCVDSNGNPHPANQKWLSNQCSTKNQCVNGTYVHTSYSCPPHAHCGVFGGEEACVCDAGWQWNANRTECVDIDECLTPANCVHGTCTNLPGTYNCSCDTFYVDQKCDAYRPRRHCADLKKYYGFGQDGMYKIAPAYSVNAQPPFSNISVYCEMSSEGGGWTLMSNALSNLMANKTFAEYVAGFGQPEIKDTWLGLDLISQMTQEMETSLKLNLHRCPRSGKPATDTFCTYESFSVLNETTQYAVVIPKPCSGTEANYYDGWVRWNMAGEGPPFVAMDNDNSSLECSSFFQNTGWWFYTTSVCGAANLNGVRYECLNTPPAPEINTFLKWNGNPLHAVQLWLRPKDFPNYDNTPPLP